MSDSFSTGLDFGTEGVSEDEVAALIRWYEQAHGEENLELVGFVPFMLGLRPDAFKASRRWSETVLAGVGFEHHLPAVVIRLLWLHLYVVIGYADGILYELIGARRLGARKGEVVDAITMAWLYGSSPGLAAAASSCRHYLDDWKVDDGAGIQWPAGWARDPVAFKSGMEFSDVTVIGEGELRGLEGWHRRVQGEVPAYVAFFARSNPVALKVFRARYENAMQCSLPKQMVALLQVHLAGVMKEQDGLRRAVHMAKVFGIERDLVVQTLTQTCRFLGDLSWDHAVTPVAAMLDEWD
jgi:hypothetical protein